MARTKRNTTPKWAPDAPKPPSRSHPPTHERDTAPLPTQITRRDTVSPPMGRHTRPGTPMGETALPPREVSQGDASLRDFHMVNTSPPNTRTAPTQGRNGSRGPPSGESGILEPLGEKTIQRCSALFQVLQDRHPHRRDGGGPETSLPGSYRDSFSLEREPAQD